MDQAGLGNEAEHLMCDIVDMIDSKFLSDETLKQLLQVYKQVVEECKVELQD